MLPRPFCSMRAPTDVKGATRVEHPGHLPGINTLGRDSTWNIYIYIYIFMWITVVMSRKFWSGENFGPGDQNFRKFGPPGPKYSEKFGPYLEKRVRARLHASQAYYAV